MKPILGVILVTSLSVSLLVPRTAHTETRPAPVAERVAERLIHALNYVGGLGGKNRPVRVAIVYTDGARAGAEQAYTAWRYSRLTIYGRGIEPQIVPVSDDLVARIQAAEIDVIYLAPGLTTPELITIREIGRSAHIPVVSDGIGPVRLGVAMIGVFGPDLTLAINFLTARAAGIHLDPRLESVVGTIFGL